MGKNGKIKIAVLLVLCMMTGMVLCGCGQTSTGQKEAGTECDYPVVATRDCPEEFLKNLEEKKINPFQMTYQDGTGSLTLCLPLDFHNPLQHSPLRLIFLSNFCFFSVLFCTLVV